MVNIGGLKVHYFDSGIWFNTGKHACFELCSGSNKATPTKFGIKPDGIINFLSEEPPFGPGEAKDIAEAHLRIRTKGPSRSS
jgi:hypothetical protein